MLKYGDNYVEFDWGKNHYRALKGADGKIQLSLWRTPRERAQHWARVGPAALGVRLYIEVSKHAEVLLRPEKRKELGL